MTKPVKKHEFLAPFPRLFTLSEGDAYDAIPFQSSNSFGDESAPALASPMTWSTEAVAVAADAACMNIPATLHPIEENTVPSWLWQHKGQGTQRAAEGDLRDIFNRVVGSAAAKAWKQGLFTSEKHARGFYDEARYALMQRHIALTPDIIAPMGIDWAYGIEDGTATQTVRATSAAALSNTTIDTFIGKTKEAASSTLWKKLFTVHGNEPVTVTLRLSDITADWHSDASSPARAAIDLMALRHIDGSVNSDALRQAARLLTILLDLHDRNDVTIGLVNLAPLLMALGLTYDSGAARAMAASLAALVTAECTATSAEMAALRGESEIFSINREAIMRSLRNHRRAVYGDDNDYEKLSVRPAPLPLKNCPDLSLVAEAQRRWNEALTLARTYGLRTTQATDLTPSPLLSVLMTCASQGLEPMQHLTVIHPTENDQYRTLLHPAVVEALSRLDYPRNTANAAAQHIMGTSSLRKAPYINHATLRGCGLSETAVEKIEAYLPCVNTIRLAITPWIVGVEFCRSKLNIPMALIQSPRFDLLEHLGFDDEEIASANYTCYGYGTARNAKFLHLRHRPLLGCGTEISADAQLRMAAAVQSFISGDTGLVVQLPVHKSIERGAEITLSAWRSGLKSLVVVFNPALEAPRQATVTTRRIKAAAQAHATPITAPRERTRGGSSTSAFVTKKPTSVKRAHKDSRTAGGCAVEFQANASQRQILVRPQARLSCPWQYASHVQKDRRGHPDRARFGYHQPLSSSAAHIDRQMSYSLTNLYRGDNWS